MSEVALIASRNIAFAPTVAEQIAVLFEAPLRHLSDVISLMRVKSQLRVLDERQLEDIGLSTAHIDELDAMDEPAGATLARLNARQRISAWAC